MSIAQWVRLQDPDPPCTLAVDIALRACLMDRMQRLVNRLFHVVSLILSRELGDLTDRVWNEFHLEQASV